MKQQQQEIIKKIDVELITGWWYFRETTIYLLPLLNIRNYRWIQTTSQNKFLPTCIVLLIFSSLQ